MAREVEKRNLYRAWWRNMNESSLLEDLGADGRIILKRLVNK
jgi:hypothetical protein